LGEKEKGGLPAGGERLPEVFLMLQGRQASGW